MTSVSAAVRRLCTRIANRNDAQRHTPSASCRIQLQVACRVARNRDATVRPPSVDTWAAAVSCSCGGGDRGALLPLLQLLVSSISSADRRLSRRRLLLPPLRLSRGGRACTATECDSCSCCCCSGSAAARACDNRCCAVNAADVDDDDADTADADGAEDAPPSPAAMLARARSRSSSVGGITSVGGSALTDGSPPPPPTKARGRLLARMAARAATARRAGRRGALSSSPRAR